MGNYEGEKLLDRIYKDLYNSKSVQHTRENRDQREESIRRYMNRLERVHSKANTEHKRNLIKKLYFDKYVISEEKIPSFADKDIIIAAQKKSLSRWIDYLTDENARYPMWAKYWAFQGMLRMGSYDSLKGVYTKRSAKTTAPFLDMNPELAAQCINNVIKIVNRDNLSEVELMGLIEIDSFQKLYTLLEKRYKEKQKEIEKSVDGIWVKYNRGNEEEAIKLAKSLEGMNTGWCTASEETAIGQLCGGAGYYGGDFYVYYTKQNNEYIVPRIAIRLDGHNHIGEIRGVDESQNLEETMIEPLEKQLKEMTFLKEKDIKENLEIIEGLKELRSIGQKTINKELLRDKEIVNLYTKHYGFGWSNDPAIEKIQKMRDSGKDYQQLSNKSDRIEFLEKSSAKLQSVEDDLDVLMHAKQNWKYSYDSILKVASERLKNDKKTILFFVNDNGEELKFASKELRSDKEVVLEAVRKKGLALQYASEELRNDKEVVLEAVKNDGYAIEYVSEELRNDKEVILTAVRDYSNALLYTNEELRNDKEVIIAAVSAKGHYLKYLSEEFRNDKEIVMAAVSNFGNALACVNEELRNDRDIALAAVKNDGLALKYVGEELKKDKEIILAAIKNDFFAITVINKEFLEDRNLLIEIMNTNGSYLRHVNKELRNNRDVVLAAVNNYGKALKYASEELRNDREIVLIAISKDYSATDFIGKKLNGELKARIAEAVNNDIALFSSADENIQKEIVIAVLKNDSEALKRAVERLKKEKKELNDILAEEQQIIKGNDNQNENALH